MPFAANLFSDLPGQLPEEVFTTLLTSANMRIERIVSFGHASPDGFWFDQERHEWVLLVQGAARLRFEEGEIEGGEIEGGEIEHGEIELRPGSFIHIPPRRRHRVEWTTPDEPTIWLAIHYGDETT